MKVKLLKKIRKLYSIIKYYDSAEGKEIYRLMYKGQPTGLFTELIPKYFPEVTTHKEVPHWRDLLLMKAYERMRPDSWYQFEPSIPAVLRSARFERRFDKKKARREDEIKRGQHIWP